MKKQDEALANEAMEESTAIVKPDYLAQTVNAGTEEVSQADLNTPTLSIIQKTSETGLTAPTQGWLYRKDTGEQYESLDVHLVYVTSIEQENFNKTGMETVKVYFGFYDGTKEPFKLYIRGWSLNGHREFQSEVALIKNRWHMPMYALLVTLNTIEVQGTQKDSGKPYTTHRLKFNIKKDEAGKPEMKINLSYADFLYASIDKFKQVATVAEVTETVHDKEQNKVEEDQTPF